jgi:hypothetical protein
MAKTVHNDVLDAALDLIKQNCTRISLCSAEPTTYAEGLTTYELAIVTVDSSDFTIGEGDVSGRKLAIGAQASITPDNAGTATHVALLDVANTKLLAVTSMTSKVLATDDLVDIATFDLEIADPT